MTYSVVFPFVEQSPRRDLREAALKKYYSRCAEINRPLIDEIVTTRRRLAGIAGVDSWSQFANEARMSGGRAADGLSRGPDGPLPRPCGAGARRLDALLQTGGRRPAPGLGLALLPRAPAPGARG